MAENYWRNQESDSTGRGKMACRAAAERCSNFDQINSLLSEWSDLEGEAEAFRSVFFEGLSGRRRKAAFLLMSVWTVTIFIHLVTWGYWLAVGITGIVGIQILRYLFAKPQAMPQLLSDGKMGTAPMVSLIVAAKNEEAVIGKLIEMLCSMDYPPEKYEVWAIDDRSTDNTPAILDKLAERYPQLKVVHRVANAGGGKSGALNQVLPQMQGEVIGVFDADAKVTKDLLRWVVPMFDDETTGALQVRKEIANAVDNFWTKGQAAEMAVDSFMQQQRIAVGGIGELRGNGQFVRRTALIGCGGWNEETITDDLDLTIRLHLDKWKIDFLLIPAVEEEGVTKARSLWHQRNRWAEGGYQRYLDYWRYIFSQPMGFGKRFDLLCWMLLQYILPAANIPDLIMATARHRLPLFGALTSLLFSLGFIGMFQGIVRIRGDRHNLGFLEMLDVTWQALRGIVYMAHWQIVMLSITARMSVRPKKLKWVKTIHEGGERQNF